MRRIFFIIWVFGGSTLLYAQTTISGTVTDESNTPLIGANVTIEGTSTGVVTDFDGNYTIQASNGDTLQFSYIGFVTKEVVVADQSIVEVSLQEDSQQLDEVVVVGYGTQKKSDITGAVASADIEAFKESPNMSPLQSLQGSVAGLNVGQVTSAGENPSFSLRGTTSISGSQTPLIILDGIIFRGNLVEINPNDIESIDILKDASSTAIYGSQAANGVVVITTKTGEGDGKPSISYSGSTSIMEAANVPKDYDTAGFVQLYQAWDWRLSRLAPDFIQPNPDFNIIDYMTPIELEGYRNGVDTDWWDLITRAGEFNRHDISVSGKSERTSYFLSGSFSNQKGIIINDDFKRISGRINLETKITDWLKIGTNSYVSSNDFSGASPSVTDAYRLTPMSSPRDESGELIQFPSGYIDSNPLLTLQVDDHDTRLTLNSVNYVILDAPFLEGLTYRVNYGNNYTVSKKFDFDPNFNNFTGRARKNNESNYNWTLDNILNFNRRFGDHNIGLTLLYGRETLNFEGTYATGDNYANQILGYDNLESGNIQRIESAAWDETSLYSMGRINYGFKNKYNATLTVRRDGFSGFGENRKFGVFPSFGLAWTISKESFILDKMPWVSNFKLRASYGENGNRTVERYATLARVNSYDAYVFGDGGGTRLGQFINTLENSDLGWETTTGLNLGLDFGFLSSRIQGNIEYYNTSTKDLLYEIEIPSLTGFNSVPTNIGEIKNNGLEFTLTTTNIQSDEFQWNSTINFSRNRNEIVTILGRDDNNDGEEDDLIASGLFIGEPLDAIYDYKIDGIYQIGDDIPSGLDAGYYRIEDLNNDGTITPLDDRTILGYEDPSYRFGILNEVTFKGLTFRAFLNSIQGGDNRYLASNSPYLQDQRISPNRNRPVEWDYWTPDNPNAEYPSLKYFADIRPNAYRQRSFVRLQDVTLSYSFDRKTLDKLKVKNLDIFVNGKNLATWTKWKGWDPETGDGFIPSRPVLKSYTLGINLSF